MKTNRNHTPKAPIDPGLQFLLGNRQPKDLSGKSVSGTTKRNLIEREIKTPDNRTVGHFTGAICVNRDELFDALGAIDQKYLDRIPGGLEYPCAALISITVNKSYENKSYGSEGLGVFERLAAESGCHQCVSRRGWPPDEDGREKSLYFYIHKNGWARLEREKPGSREIPWMFKDLQNKTLQSESDQP